MTTLYNGMTVPKVYTRGLGYSPASGPQVGGLDVGANPYVYSSTFFGSDVKGLLPQISNFSSKRKSRKRKSIRKLKRKSIRKLKRKTIRKLKRKTIRKLKRKSRTQKRKSRK